MSDPIIGQILQLQGQRITRIQQALDRISAALDAQADTLERIRKDGRR